MKSPATEHPPLGSVVITCRPGKMLSKAQTEKLSAALSPLFPGCNTIHVESMELDSPEGRWRLIQFTPYAVNRLDQEALT